MYMRDGYILHVDTALAAIGWEAARLGAEACEDEGVVAVDRRSRSVTTSQGRAIRYKQLVLTAGPWTNSVLQTCGLQLLPLVVSNEQTLDFATSDGWRTAGGAPYSHGRMPIFSWSEAGYKGRAANGGCRYFYSIPQLEAAETGHHQTLGFKIGFHRQGPLMSTPDSVVSEGGRRGIARMPHERKEIVDVQDGGTDEHALTETRRFIAAKLPGLAPTPTLQMRCLYQNTPDLSMLLGTHPEDERIVVACGFSGGVLSP
eukprot:5146888-Prymnesium_polylepis.1